MRLLFIHGFGEDEAIFSKIAPHISGEHIFLNAWTLLGNTPRPTVNVLDFAKEIVQKYAITQQDVIIGHSMGGWIAYHIKHLTDSPIVQIGSWTDADRPILPISNRHIVYWAIRNGLFFNRFLKERFTIRGYKNKPSAGIYREIFDKLIQGNKENVINQMRLILTPIAEKITVTPDLRIHALKDVVVRPPREPFHEVLGDHFTLYTHPEAVFEPILAFLNKNTEGYKF
jgi:pimeloyl-ACP methyl ester carboxylesterase